MKSCLAIVLVWYVAIRPAAQPSMKSVEKDLLNASSRVFSCYQTDHDSLEMQSELFTKKISSYIRKYPATLSYPFQSLKDSNACFITTSDDGLFRIYSWDTWTGGSMHIFDNIFQYRSGGKVYALHSDRVEGDAGSFYSEIFTVRVNGKVYYLAIGNSIASTKDAGQFVKVFIIENNLLNDTMKLFRTKTELLNNIYVAFDFFSVADRPERPLKLIKYDPIARIVYIPIVEGYGKVTDRFILYQFKRGYFEYILTQKSR